MIRKMNLKKYLMGLVLSVALFIVATVGVHAASFTYPGTVTGDGVRIRTIPDTGTILELMYKGEGVMVDKEMTFESSSGSYYLKRNSTGRVGYSDSHYISVPGIWN